MNQRFLCVVKNCRIGDGKPPRGRLVYMYFHSKMKLQINNFFDSEATYLRVTAFFPYKNDQILWKLKSVRYPNLMDRTAKCRHVTISILNTATLGRAMANPRFATAAKNTSCFCSGRQLDWRNGGSRRAGHEARKAPPSSRFVWWSTYPWVQRWAPRNCLCLMRISQNIIKKLYIKMCIAGLHCSCIWRKKELRIWKSNITSVVWFAPGTRNN